MTDASTITQAATAVFLGIASGIGVIYSRKASNRSKDNGEALAVPSTAGNGPSKTGESLSRVERDISEMNDRAKEAVVVARVTADKVEALQLEFARHRGEHAGMARDVERLLAKVYNGGDAA